MEIGPDTFHVRNNYASAMFELMLCDLHRTTLTLMSQRPIETGGSLNHQEALDAVLDMLTEELEGAADYMGDAISAVCTRVYNRVAESVHNVLEHVEQKMEAIQHDEDEEEIISHLHVEDEFVDSKRPDVVEEVSPMSESTLMDFEYCPTESPDVDMEWNYDVPRCSFCADLGCVNCLDLIRTDSDYAREVAFGDGPYARYALMLLSENNAGWAEYLQATNNRRAHSLTGNTEETKSNGHRAPTPFHAERGKRAHTERGKAWKPCRTMVRNDCILKDIMETERKNKGDKDALKQIIAEVKIDNKDLQKEINEKKSLSVPIALPEALDADHAKGGVLLCRGQVNWAIVAASDYKLLSKIGPLPGDYRSVQDVSLDLLRDDPQVSIYMQYSKYLDGQVEEHVKSEQLSLFSLLSKCAKHVVISRLLVNELLHSSAAKSKLMSEREMCDMLKFRMTRINMPPPILHHNNHEYSTINIVENSVQFYMKMKLDEMSLFQCWNF